MAMTSNQSVSASTKVAQRGKLRTVAIASVAVAVAAAGWQWRRSRGDEVEKPQIPLQPVTLTAAREPITDQNAAALRWTSARVTTDKFHVEAVSNNFRYALVSIGNQQVKVVDLQSGKQVASSLASDRIDFYEQSFWLSDSGVAAVPLQDSVRLVSARGTETVFCEGMEREVFGAIEGNKIAFVRAGNVACVVDSATGKRIERTDAGKFRKLEDAKRPHLIAQGTLRSFEGPVELGFNVRKLNLEQFSFDVRNEDRIDRHGDQSDNFVPVATPSNKQPKDGSTFGEFRNTKTNTNITMPGPWESAGRDAVVRVDGQLHVFDLESQKLLPAFTQVGPANPGASAATQRIQFTENPGGGLGGTLRFADGSERRVKDSTLETTEASLNGVLEAWITNPVLSTSPALYVRNSSAEKTIALPLGAPYAIAPFGDDKLVVVDGGLRLLFVDAELNVSTMKLNSGRASNVDLLSGVSFGMFEAATSPKGDLVATFGNNSGTLRVFRVADGMQVASITQDFSVLRNSGDLRWSADGTSLIVGMLRGDPGSSRWELEYAVVDSSVKGAKP
jgi:WD40 repeat protein